MVGSKKKVAKKSHATKKPRGICRRKGPNKKSVQEEGTLSKPVQEKGGKLMNFLQFNHVSTYQTSDEEFEKVMTISEICTVLVPISDDENEQLRERESKLAKLKASIKDPGITKERLLELAEEGESLKKSLYLLKDDLNLRRKTISTVRAAKDKATKAACYWEGNDEIREFAKWQRIIHVANRLLIECDKPNVANNNSPSFTETTLDMEESVDELDEANMAVRPTARAIDLQFAPAIQHNRERKEKESVSTRNKKRRPKTKNSVFNKRETFWNHLTGLIAEGAQASLSEFSWDGGRIYCMLCGGTVTNYRHTGDHIKTKKHQKMRDQAGSDSIVSRQTRVNAHLVPTVSSIEEKVYRMEALKSICKANLSLCSLNDIKPWIEKYSKPGLTLGNAKDLARMYAKPVRKAIFDDIKVLLTRCRPQFSISLDGTPSFAEAECIMLRVVTRNLQIVELVVRIALFRNKIDANELANHIIKTINLTLGLHMTDWLSVQLDRASTNKAAVSRIKDKYTTSKPATNFCASHGLNNAGKKFVESTKYAEHFRKLWQAIIQYPGKARSFAASIFNESVRTCHGVLFFRSKNKSSRFSKLESNLT